MHELSVCQSIIDQVSQIADQHRSGVVEKIYLQIGPLSGVEPELLQSAFPLARANSVARYADLVISMLPVRVHCVRCGADSDAQSNRLVCGHCGNWQTQLLSGDELILERVELQKQH